MSNVFSCVGNIGKDAETRQAGNSNVTVFSLANTTGYGEKEQTLWLDCQIWGKKGEGLCPHLAKGTKVWVSGELTTREYEGKSYKQLNVSGFEFAGSQSGGSGSQVPF